MPVTYQAFILKQYLFIGTYTKIVHLKLPSKFIKDCVSLSKALLANCSIKDKTIVGFLLYKVRCSMHAKFKGTGYSSNPNQMGEMILE